MHLIWVGVDRARPTNSQAEQMAGQLVPAHFLLDQRPECFGVEERRLALERRRDRVGQLFAPAGWASR